MGRLSGICSRTPGTSRPPPGLNKLLEDQVGPPDCYFIHDVAVHPAQRGMGVAQLLVAAAFAHAAARGFPGIALVAVQNSRGFWERRGFRLVSEAMPAVGAVRRSYGSQAHYMIRGSAEPGAAPDPACM
jgi:ribosomal protein S18 acetylase RimI-like enzyme